MISHLQGTIIFRGKDFIIIDVNGVGYKVFLSDKTLSKLPEKETLLKLYTFLYWREKAVELYGFLTLEELKLFELLNDISGIGPRTALQLTSFGSLEQLKNELNKGKVDIKGLGHKKLQKIMLELTGKIKELQKAPAGNQEYEEDEALEALVSLGVKVQHARSALRQVAPEISDIKMRIKEALKILGKSR